MVSLVQAFQGFRKYVVAHQIWIFCLMQNPLPLWQHYTYGWAAAILAALKISIFCLHCQNFKQWQTSASNDNIEFMRSRSFKAFVSYSVVVHCLYLLNWAIFISKVFSSSSALLSASNFAAFCVILLFLSSKNFSSFPLSDLISLISLFKVEHLRTSFSFDVTVAFCVFKLVCKIITFVRCVPRTSCL